MSETDNRKEGTDPLEGTGEAKMEKITLDVGYDGWSSNDTRPVRFTGRLVADTSNHSYQGPNQNRWHSWTLYKVPGGYRVYDCYRTMWQGESDHYSLSDVLTPAGVAEDYPALAHEYFDVEEIAVDLDE